MERRTGTKTTRIGFRVAVGLFKGRSSTDERCGFQIEASLLGVNGSRIRYS